nr:ATP-binding protein [Lottiidibacillus patelloidae]
MINNTALDSITSQMDVTVNLNIKSFLGAPIRLKNGEMYGTLCAISTELYSFSDKDIALFQSMASFLSYYIELENNESLYRQVVEKSPDGILIENNDGIIYANHSATEMLSEQESDVIGKSVASFIDIPKLHLPHSSSHPSKDIDTKKTSEMQLMKDDGKSVDIETITTPITYKEEIVSQVMLRNVTKRKEMEDLLLKAEKLTIAGQLAAGVAHEIRNPMASIKGFVQLLKASHINNEKYCEIVLTEIERINMIVNEFLYLAKPEVYQYEMHNCIAILEEVITLLDSQANMNNVQFIKNFNENLPLFECEKNQLKQVFINIIKNAIEVMPLGGNIQIIITSKEDYVYFKFIDDGPGIPKERLAHLGEPFYTTKEKGTGLGLMITRKIIEEHNGSIVFSSEINQGTIVDISLPIFQEQQVDKSKLQNSTIA